MKRHRGQSTQEKVYIQLCKTQMMESTHIEVLIVLREQRSFLKVCSETARREHIPMHTFRCDRLLIHGSVRVLAPQARCVEVQRVGNSLTVIV